MLLPLEVNTPWLLTVSAWLKVLELLTTNGWPAYVAVPVYDAKGVFESVRLLPVIWVIVVPIGMPLAAKVSPTTKPEGLLTVTTLVTGLPVVLNMPVPVMDSPEVMTEGAESVRVVPAMLVIIVPAGMPVPLTGWPTSRLATELTPTVVAPATLAELDVSEMLPFAVRVCPETMTEGLESVSTLPAIDTMVVLAGMPVPVMD